MIKRYYTWEDVRSSLQTCKTYSHDQLNFASSDTGRRLVLGLPYEVKDEIFKRIPLPYIALCINEECLTYRKTFELACRNNNIQPKNVQDIDWHCEFLSIWNNFKTKRFHEEPDWTWTSYMDTKIGMEITGRKLYVTENYTLGTKYIERLKINLELTQLKDPPSGNQRKTHVLGQTYELRGSTLHCNFSLGNRHDLLYYDQETITSRLTFEGSANVTKLAFDNEDRVYYYQTINGSTRFYRKTFGTSDESKLLATFMVQIDMVDLSIGNDKLFATFYLRPFNNLNPLYVMCANIKKNCTRIVEIRYFDRNYSLVVHNNCFVYSNQSDHTIIYKFDENDMTPYAVRGARRQVLNKNTYLVLEEIGDKPDYRLKTITILDDGPIVHFVQFCEQHCVFRRLGDNFFYVLERKRRQLWYQDDIGSRPIRLATDGTRTKIKPGRQGYEFSSPEES